jgi:hypothetical protein
LCPVDFSDASRHALDHALAMAKWYDPAITVLHVTRAGSSGAASDERRRFEEQLQGWTGPTDGNLIADARLERGDP